MRMVITANLFDAYLHCPTKFYLRMLGEQGKKNLYSDWIRTQDNLYRIKGIKLWTKGIDVCDCINDAHCSADNITMSNWKYLTNIAVRSKNLESDIHVLERLPSAGRGYQVHFIPVLFIFNNKLSKYDKLLITYDAIVLSEMLCCDVSLGKIIHGDKHKSVRVKTTSLTNEVRKVLKQISSLMSDNSPPDLILNRHCTECEYESGCRQKAMEKDDLSLLTSMSEKERKKLNSKGIFTVTQLSYTFRPRRRPKQLRDKQEKYHHSLKALAIRENKIYIVGEPSIKIDGTPVYIDVEGSPDREFYYLIGMRIRNNDESVVQHSLWANSEAEEKIIWHEFLRLLSTIERPVLIHFGSFETKFIKHMYRRYGNPFSGAVLERALNEPCNIVSNIYAQVYFPAYSNGLKEISRYLGFEWTDIDCAGVLSTVQRHLWEHSSISSIKNKLIRYNGQDCEALELLAKTIHHIGDSCKTNMANPINQRIGASIVHADSGRFKKIEMADIPKPSFELGISILLRTGTTRGPCLCTIWTS